MGCDEYSETLGKGGRLGIFEISGVENPSRSDTKKGSLDSYFISGNPDTQFREMSELLNVCEGAFGFDKDSSAVFGNGGQRATYHVGDCTVLLDSWPRDASGSSGSLCVSIYGASSDRRASALSILTDAFEKRDVCDKE